MADADTKEYTESVTKDAKSGDTAEALRSFRRGTARRYAGRIRRNAHS